MPAKKSRFLDIAKSLSVQPGPQTMDEKIQALVKMRGLGPDDPIDWGEVGHAMPMAQPSQQGLPLIGSNVAPAQAGGQAQQGQEGLIYKIIEALSNRVDPLETDPRYWARKRFG